MYGTIFIQQTIGSGIRKRKANKEAALLHKILYLPAGAAILDIPCGTGRHAVLLAKKGYKVTGVDINPLCLRIARRKNKHPNVCYLRGSMINLKKFKGKFDAVLNLFTSFGYFSTEEKNERVFQELAAALKPGGKLVLNMIERDWLLRNFQETRWMQDGKFMVVVNNRYERKTKYMQGLVIFVEKKTFRSTSYFHRLRLYSKNEIIRLMRQNNLKNIKIYGDLDGSPYNRLRSHHPFYVGEKKR